MLLQVQQMMLPLSSAAGKSVPAQYRGKLTDRSLEVPGLIHFELTTRCPLNCPQCYNITPHHKDFDFGLLTNYLQEAARLKVLYVALSGGEPLVYPHLTETILQIRALGMNSTMATSGCGLNAKRLNELGKAGMGWLWISLNGSTEEIHYKSRDKYDDAVRALELLQKTDLLYGINWVARKDNAHDFSNLVDLAKKYGVQAINILRLKPDSHKQVPDLLDGPELAYLAAYLKSYSNPAPAVYIETCFSVLRTLVHRDRYQGIEAGCAAGRQMMAVDVDGNFRPCRHLSFPEKGLSIANYWSQSDTINKLRSTEENVLDPCKSCGYLLNCRTCRATCANLYGDFNAGEKACLVWQAKVAD